VNGHLYRSLSVAEDVLRGRFRHAGITLELGEQPDWHSDALPADAEWRIEWSKFYYGLDLAHAFGVAGDVRFLDAWEQLVLSWIDQVAADFDPSDVAARRILNWIYAWQGFAASAGFPGLAHGSAERILASLRDQLGHVRAHLTPERNHRTLELYALFIAGLAFPELDPGFRLQRFSLEEIDRNLHTDVFPDGVHCESSTHYHAIALRSYLGTRENARRFGLAVSDRFDARLSSACEFLMHVIRPDGSLPMLSDADTGDYRDLLELAARLLGREDFRWVASGGRLGKAPTLRSASFPLGGYHVQRSGWGEREPFACERHLIFDCGPLGAGGHGHYDALHVEVAAGGLPLLIDPGRYTYAEDAAGWRRRFKGTAAHNTVCVDGCDQTPYRRSKPKGQVAEARLLARITAPSLDLLWGEVRSHVYEAVHRRRVLFVGDAWWLLEDDLRGSLPHRYELRLHLTPAAQGSVSVDSAEDAWRVRAPGLWLGFAPGHPRPRLLPGWVAPSYGHRVPAPVVSLLRVGAACARFLTLVVPSRADALGPELRVSRAETAVCAVEVRNCAPERGIDELAFADERQELALGPFRVHARIAWLRRGPGGEVLAFSAGDVLEATGPAAGAVRPARFVTKVPTALVWETEARRFRPWSPGNSHGT
jgi:hypothetical protein